MTESRERWWCIAESELRAALGRVDSGDDPEIVMLELLANSETEDYRGSNGDDI